MPIRLPQMPKVSDVTSFITGNNNKHNIDIDTYRSRFLSGARSYLFMCNIQFPGIQNALVSGVMAGLGGSPDSLKTLVTGGIKAGVESAINSFGANFDTKDFKYYVKSTNLPDSSIDEVTTNWAGQQYKMSGARKFNDWTVTLLIDHDANVLRKFWDWQLIIQNPENNTYGSPKDYMVDQSIQLLSSTGSPICTYTLRNAWPKVIGEVSLDYGNNDFATVDIQFAYQYHVITETEESGLMNIGRKALNSFGFDTIKKLF